MQNTPDYFDALFTGDADPWKFKSRWYEARKRALTMASLLQPRYNSAFEPGCAGGELSTLLAQRCDRLLVSDGSAVAVEMARKNLHDQPNITVCQSWLPRQWPVKTFDLIVLSEFGFYLSGADVDAMGLKAAESLCEGGTLVACHWRRPISGCEVSGDEVHQRLFSAMSRVAKITQISQTLEPDMRLDVWSTDTRSVAQREGFA